MTGAFSHSPLSGLETGEPGVPDFYRENELKYHGRANRGVTAINFMQVRLLSEFYSKNNFLTKRNYLICLFLILKLFLYFTSPLVDPFFA